MAAIGGDDKVGFGPCAVECPRAFHGANNIVTALHNDPGDVLNPRGAAEQLIVRFKKALVDKVVGLNTRERQGELILQVVAGKCSVGQELRGGALPSTPNLCSGEAHGGIVAGKAAIVWRKHVL